MIERSHAGQLFEMGRPESGGIVCLFVEAEQIYLRGPRDPARVQSSSPPFFDATAIQTYREDKGYMEETHGGTIRDVQVPQSVVDWARAYQQTMNPPTSLDELMRPNG